ncbi:MAG TPA: FAD/NAD(P)-binding protein [Luteimonas sp.]|nr:FAD/NAD(P)-binding protein [Luteimonas sp.]
MPTLPPDTRSFDVVIIGGGASGTLVAIHLLRGAAGTPPRIALLEPSGTPGRGVAYSTSRPEHLLNVISAKMSAFDADPAHFVRHLLAQDPGAQRGPAVAPGAPALAAARIAAGFAPRRAYARYLQDTLAASPGAGDVVHVDTAAVDIEPSALGHAVVLASGMRLHARSVVLAVGNEARALPLRATDVHGTARVVDAWDYESVAAIDAAADVCIVGSGLSMVDAVMTLANGGHRGRIQVLSRHGLTPLAHAEAGGQAVDVRALEPLSMRARMRALRTLARGNQARGLPWQWTLDAVRHHTQDLWLHASERERARFLRHAARVWDIHRHRIAPSVAATLQRLSASGQLQVHAGRALALHADGATMTLRVRPRGGSREQALDAQVIVNATGIETAFARGRRPLLGALAARGSVRAGPQGLGLATAADGTLLDREGHAQPGLFALGALRIGELWETIAIPDIRGQAAAVAGAVHARSAGQARHSGHGGDDAPVSGSADAGGGSGVR